MVYSFSIDDIEDEIEKILHQFSLREQVLLILERTSQMV